MVKFYVPSNDESRDKAWRLSMEQRMDNLETQQRLFNSSIKGGAIQVLRDSDAALAINLGVGGYSQPDNTVREAELLAFFDSDTGGGNFHMLVDEKYGWIAPRMQFNFSPDTFTPITSSSFVNVWKSQIHTAALCLVCSFLVTCDSGTVGKARLSLSGILSDEITINATEQKLCKFAWDLTGKYGYGLDLSLRVQAMRVSGTGNVNVYSPDVCHMAGLNMRTDKSTGGISTSG